jgi:hypothetical protein
VSPTDLVEPVDLHTQLFTLLNTLTDVTVYDGEIDTDPPKDTAGRVKPYVVLFSGSGDASHRARLVQAQKELAWRPTVTCAAGYQAHLLHLVSRVRQLLIGAVFEVDGVSMQPLKAETGPDAAPIDKPPPARWFQPLPFSTVAHRVTD